MGFEQRLTALDLALSQVVVEPPASWRLDRLRDEAKALSAEASTNVERLAAREVASRIDRFTEIARGFATPAPVAKPTQTVDSWRSPSGVGSTDAPSSVAPPVRLTKRGPAESTPARSTATRRRHDAEGVLRPVVSKRPDAPRYAIVNDRGRVETFVTPSPRLESRFDNLVGRRVALDGRRGYRADLKREHLVAERVTPLRR